MGQLSPSQPIMLLSSFCEETGYEFTHALSVFALPHYLVESDNWYSLRRW